MSRITRWIAPALIASCLTARAQEPSYTLIVEAGEHDRIGTAVSVPHTFSLGAGRSPALFEVAEGKRQAVPVQVEAGDPPRLWWIMPGTTPAGSKRTYQLVGVESPPPAKAPISAVTDDKATTFSLGDKVILRYNHAVVNPPDGVEALFARSGYIHPLRSPAGKLLTNDFPKQHLHHHGVWFPWTETRFEDQPVDFWNSGKGEGRVEFVKYDAHGSGPVFAYFTAQHRHVALKTQPAPKTVLHETWRLRVFALDALYLFDLDSTQTCAGDSPLKLLEYRYGGIGYRGSDQWEGEGDKCRFLTSAGKTRDDGHATRADWCAVWQKVDGQPAGIVILGHPSNFRSPQPMRIHPSEPFLNFAPPQAGDFSIEPGKPYVSKYRFVLFDGEPNVKRITQLWHDYADPPKVRVEP